MTTNRENKLENAVKVCTTNPTIRLFLQALDPKALKQLEDALEVVENPVVAVDTSERAATDEQVQTLCDWLSQKSEDEWGDRCEANVSTFTFKRGRKNIKIIDNRTNAQSVWGFIDVDTGNIMKAASWNAPDPKRYKRGSIWDSFSWTTCVVYM